MDNTNSQPEAAPEIGNEQPVAPELPAQPAGAPQPAPVVTPAPMPDLSQVDVPAQPSPVGEVVPSAPQVADDVDVIEKEWVDKAEQIVSQTKGDPYQEEELVEDLQIDYLKKRYGKDIKKTQG